MIRTISQGDPMYFSQYNQQYPARQSLTGLPVGAVAAMGMVGAMLGGIVAAARDARALEDGEKNRKEAAGDIVKEAVGTGLAAAVGAAAGGAFFRSGPLALAAMAAVGIGTKYLYDGLTGTTCRLNKNAEVPADDAAKKA